MFRTTNVVLSPYHNPPYRSPTTAEEAAGPRNNTCHQTSSRRPQDHTLDQLKSSPSSSSSTMETRPGHSPKRKRGNESTVSSSAEPAVSALQSGRSRASRQSTPPQRPDGIDSTPTSTFRHLNGDSSIPGINGDNLSTLPASAKASSSGADSPRTKVATHFQNLHLWRSADSDASNLSTSAATTTATHVAAAAAGGDSGGVGRPESRGGLRKRPRWSEDEKSHAPSSDTRASQETDRGTGDSRMMRPKSAVSCIPETPDCRPDTRVASPPLSPASSPSPSPTTRYSEPGPGGESSSSPSFATKSSEERDLDTGTTCDPKSIPPQEQQHQRQQQDEPSTFQTHLTWQPFEITGHEIDFASGDDDGEGINGVGFKPTPALAWARQQRRKQQVNEWRAREAREARSRRMERRRGERGSVGLGLVGKEVGREQRGLTNDDGGGEDGDGGGGGVSRARMVRFAEVT